MFIRERRGKRREKRLEMSGIAGEHGYLKREEIGEGVLGVDLLTGDMVNKV